MGKDVFGLRGRILARFPVGMARCAVSARVQRAERMERAAQSWVYRFRRLTFCSATETAQRTVSTF
jgi:hypothetical protein